MLLQCFDVRRRIDVCEGLYEFCTTVMFSCSGDAMYPCSDYLRIEVSHSFQNLDSKPMCKRKIDSIGNRIDMSGCGSCSRDSTTEVKKESAVGKSM